MCKRESINLFLLKKYHLFGINEDHFKVLRKIQKKPESSQRELAKELGFSLGKLNYCLKALQEKGLIKIKSFKKNPKKINNS